MSKTIDDAAIIDFLSIACTLPKDSRTAVLNLIESMALVPNNTKAIMLMSAAVFKIVHPELPPTATLNTGK